MRMSRKSSASKTENESELCTYPKVNVFKLLFGLADYKDCICYLLAFLGTCGMGILFPIRSITLGNSVSAIVSSRPEAVVEVISLLCIKFTYLGLGMFAASFVSFFFSMIILRRYSNKLKLEYFRSLMRQEQSFYDSRNVFEFATKFQAQMKIINSAIGPKVFNFVQAVSTLIACFLFGFIMISWKMSLILMSVFPFIFIASYLVVKGVADSQEKTQKYFEQACGIAEEVLYNIKTVATFANFKYEQSRFDEKVKLSYDMGKKEGLSSAIIRAVEFLFIFASFGLAFGVGSIFIANKETDNGGSLFNIGEVLILIFCIVLGGYNLAIGIPVLKSIAAACEASKELFFISERVPNFDLSESKLKPSRENIKGSIEFREVCFSYNGSISLFNKFNLTLEPCSLNAIIGENGSGKSSLANFLLRLYDYESGSIMIDDFEIKKLDLEYLRSLIGYVPQNPVLFNVSLRENITTGNKKISDEEIIYACNKSGVSDFMNELKDGLNTKIGIKGSNLSGGQKQMIAIARAIIRKPKILIFDEATSAIDLINKIKINELITNLAKEITTIFITHRISDVKTADKIIFLSKGTIAEVGTHESLIQMKGLYSRLNKIQEVSEMTR